MHGRLKVKTSAEQEESKRKAREEKLKVYKAVTQNIFDKRKNEVYDDETLKLTGQLLEQNPEFYTFWNFRREIFQHIKTEKTNEELQKYASDELSLTQNSLRSNPKSYSAWHHRFWSMEFFPDPDWKKELKLCGYFLSLDERNFHCWDYRRQVAKKCEVIPADELVFTTDLIEKNFSNYSAWHYRSKLLPLVHPGATDGSVDEEILLKEFQMVQNAAFTDPNDQSAWFYHRWLLGRNKVPLEILNVSVLKAQNKLAVLLNEPTKIGEDNYSLCVYINGTNQEVVWKANNPTGPVSPIWVCDLPTSILQGDADNNILVKLIEGDVISSLTCCANGNSSFVWKNNSRTNAFQSELSAARKEVLEQELESCQQLYEFEPDNKWTLFTSILLMRALNAQVYAEEIEKYMNQLIAVDSQREGYYKDLRSKFLIENVLETLPVEAQTICIMNKGLTSLYHFEQLLLIRTIDLSQNCITSILPLCNLICVHKIILDNNRISSCEGLARLQSLENLSLKNNHIAELSTLEILISCPQLQHLSMENNAVENEPNYILALKKIASLQCVDGIAL